jgi:hypothetical protein
MRRANRARHYTVTQPARVQPWQMLVTWADTGAVEKWNANNEAGLRYRANQYLDYEQTNELFAKRTVTFDVCGAAKFEVIHQEG